MAKLAMVLTITFSLFLLTLARHSIDLPQIEISEESNTSLSLEDPNRNQSTDLKISDSTKEELVLDPKIESNEDPNTSLSLEDPNPNQNTNLETIPSVDESGIIIGREWDTREEDKLKEKKVITKKKSKKSDESDSDSDESDSDSDDESDSDSDESDSDDEEEKREMRMKKKSKKGKKGGFVRWFRKLINHLFD